MIHPCVVNARLLLIPAIAAALVAGGCGSNKTQSQTAAPATSATTTKASQSSSNAGALQAEAKSAATGDIPDNQVFLAFRNRAAGYSIKYPEGWAQSGSAKRTTFRDKNNIVRIVVATGPAPTVAHVRAESQHLAGAHVKQPPARISIGGGPAIKVVYTTQSAASPVTRKRVTLVVDRYYLAGSGRRAVVDLGTPQGVDNVDAYRLMIQSFRWR